MKYFDSIIIFLFLSVGLLSMNMWYNYDKLEQKIKDQNKIIKDMMFSNNDLYVEKENCSYQLLQCRTLYKEY